MTKQSDPIEDGAAPFVRKPLSEQNVVDLPPYPGLPSKTGRTTATVVSRKNKKPPKSQPAVPA